MNERLEDIVSYRRKKLENFIAAGIDPYPSSTHRTHTNHEVLGNFEELQTAATIITVVGRIRSMRTMGKLAFVNLEDGTGRIQILLKADSFVDKEKFDFFVDNFDIGDFAEFTGTLFVTKSGEKTVEAVSYEMLAKSLLPLPSEHYGLEDQEQRLRKRYLDILLNPENKELFVKKNKFWTAMRQFFVEHGFLEVEMPVLEPTPGGAEAEPFVTHHNALDRSYFLRISLELPLKKMLVAGFEKVFEIGRIFRNEGISTTHLQDYTQMEFYWAYSDFQKMMDLVREMYQFVIQETFGTLSITSGAITVDWSGEWQTVDYMALFKEYTKIDLETADDAQLKAYADSQHIKYEDFARRGRLIDLIFKKIRASIPTDKPVFLVNQPIELEPLAKRDPNNPKVVQRMQIIAYGTELGKGFGELNDPLDQRKRFEAQMELREAGDSEAQHLDEDYMEAMEYGMPPAAGFGLSERLFAVLADKSVREAVIFPLMKDAK
jgi:lysyl-tRNA synthetase class 2